MNNPEKTNSIIQFDTFLDAVNTLNQQPIENEDDDYDPYDKWAKEEFDETLAKINYRIDLTKSFVNFFNGNELLTKYYYFEKNDDFWKLAKAYNSAKNFMKGEPQVHFTQSNSNDNNFLNNLYYELQLNIDNFVKYSKDKITDIEILAMPEELEKLFEETERKKKK